jgi:3-phosphoshikimate 1-carboxyvinyltransferase
VTTRTFVGPEAPFRATVVVPGDKSLSHRALILAGMATGESRVDGLGPGADVASTASCLRRFGVVVEPGRVRSAGIDAWSSPGAPLDAGNSGTTLRLLAGAAAGRRFATTLTGDRSLAGRPMRPLVAPLEALGARVEVSSTGTPPVTVHGAVLRGTVMHIPVASAQIRTAFTLAALQAEGESVIDSPPGYRDHTERWLEALGRGAAAGATAFRVRPGPVAPIDVTLPGDPSSAAFLWVAAALGGGEVITPGVSLNPGRTGLLDVLAAMGVEVEAVPTGDVLGDPLGTVTVRGPVRHGFRVDGSLAVRTLDELPLVGLLGAVAPGESVVADAAELRGKETDRIASTVALLTALGATAAATADGFHVAGSGLRPGRFDAGGDHRLAMAAAVAATRAGRVDVVGSEAAAVSWPGFADTLERMWSSR